MVTPISAVHRLLPESPLRTNTRVQVSTPESKHYLHNLIDIRTPEKEYLKNKPKHTVIPTLSSRASPLKDMDKIRAGLADKVKAANGLSQYKVVSESTGRTRTYQEHQTGHSQRLVPVSGPNFLVLKGAQLAEAIERYQIENKEKVLKPSIFYEKLKESSLNDPQKTRDAKPSNPPPAMDGQKSTPPASSFLFMPRSLLVKKNASIPSESQATAEALTPKTEVSGCMGIKRTASEAEFPSLYPAEWKNGKSEPPAKRLKINM